MTEVGFELETNKRTNFRRAIRQYRHWLGVGLLLFIALSIALLSFIYKPAVAATPGGVTNPTLWLRADIGTSSSTDNTAISSWTDQSTQANNGTQGTGSLQPLFKNNATDNINFNPVVKFDGTDDFMGLTVSKLPTGTTARSVVMVATTTTTGTRYSIAWGTNATGQAQGIATVSGTLNYVGWSADVTSASFWATNVPNQTIGTFAGSGGAVNLYGKGKLLTGPTNRTWNTSTAGARLGASPWAGEYWSGPIADVLVFPRVLSAAERQRVDSYLAVKYGFTIDQTSATDYQASDSSTIWNATTNATYKNNITAIGRDDTSSLNQKQSKSTESNALVTVGNGNTIAATNSANSNDFSADKSFLTFGDDNGTIGWTAIGAPMTRQIAGRVFKAQVTGTVGSVKVQVPDNGSSLTTKLPAEQTTVYLLTDADGDFSSGATETAMTLNGTNWEANAALTNGQYFTFATQLAAGTITGNVFNDLNANGAKDGSEAAFPGLAIINVYNSSGTYVKSRTSDSNGDYRITGLSAGTYYLTVDNTSRVSASDVAPGLINTVGVHLEQTYASGGSGGSAGTGPVCTGAQPTYTSQPYTGGSSPGNWTVGVTNGGNAGPCFGGRLPGLSNGVLTGTPASFNPDTDYTNVNDTIDRMKHVTKVVSGGTNVISGVDWGFSPDVVTNANDGISSSDAGQGTYRSFLTNVTLISGTHTMRFVPAVPTNNTSGTNKWWSTTGSLGTYPALNNSNANGATIDGTAYSNVDGTTVLNTNAGTWSALPSIGTGGYSVANYQSPEFEIRNDPFLGGVSTPILRVAANNITISHMAFTSTVDYPSTETYYIQQTAGMGMTVQDNIIGARIFSSGGPATNMAMYGVGVAFASATATTGTIKHNIITTRDYFGVQLAGAGNTNGNVVANTIGDWRIEELGGTSGSVTLGGGTNRILIQHDAILGVKDNTTNPSVGNHQILQNTLPGGFGITLAGSDSNLIQGNVLNDNFKGVAVGTTSINNKITQNSFVANDVNAIDLGDNGVSGNTNACTASGTGGANNNLARPTLSSASISGTTLTLNGTYCATGNYDIEIYKAAADTDGSDGTPPAGEGVTYLGTLSNVTGGTISNQTLTASGLTSSDAVTAIAINRATNDTSEFSLNTMLSTPSAPDMTAATDTGSSNSDNITKDSTPDFTGSCTNGDTVTLVIDGTPITPTQVCSGGVYTITPGSAIADGNHNATVTFTNTNGVSAPSSPLAFTIDTAAPSAPGTPDMTAATDTGSSNSDNITKNNTPAFTGSCTNGETISLYVDGSLSGVQTCSGGTYTITVSSSLTDGSHSVTATATDVAGNESSPSSGLTITIDTTAPAAPVISAPSNNSKTNDNTPTFSGTGENGATVTVTDETGATICSGVVSSSNWTCTPSVAVSDGPHTFKSTQTDVAGNTSVQSNTVAVTIDTVAPTAPVISSPANGSYTNDNTPTINGTGEPAATLHLVIDGGAPVNVTVDGSGNWTYTPGSPLGNSSHTLVATQTDAANNTSSASPTTTFTVDTTTLNVTVNQKAGQPDPTATNSIFYTIVFNKSIINTSTFGPSDITIGTSPSSPGAFVNTFTQLNSTTWEFEIKGMANGTTVSPTISAAVLQDLAGNSNAASTSTDNSVLYQVTGPTINELTTNDNTPTLTGDCTSGHNITLDLSGPATHNYSGIVCGGGSTYSFNVPDILPDGVYDVVVTDTTASVTNPTDNQTDALTIDTVVPTVTVNQKVGQADPTNVNSAAFTVVFSKNMVGSSLTAGDFTLGGTGTGSITGFIQLNTTTWEVTVTGMTSGDTVTLSLGINKANDPAGNGNAASTSTDNSVTFDNTAPAAPVITSPTNGALTNDNTPTVTGTGENGATVSVTDELNNVICTAIVSSGNWSCTPSSALSDGPHTLKATQTDGAGNTSGQSNLVSITIDTAAPATPVAPDMTAATDTGSSNSDNITKDTTPDFTGTCTPGDIIKLYSDGGQVGIQTCPGGGTYTITSTALSEGPHNMTVTFTDPAGNVSAASPALAITIDTSIPTTPSTPDMTAATDTGSSNSDNITNNTQPTFTGTCTTGDVVTLLVDGSSVGTQTCSSGTYTISPSSPISAGSHTVTATAMDVAGNTSPASSGLSITIMTAIPSAPGIPDMTAATDTGSSNTDNTTKDNTPDFTGSCTNGLTVKFYIDGTLAASQACSGGTYTITSPLLADGNHSATASQIDVAGNESSQTSALAFTIDTVAPTAPTITSPVSGSITNDNTPTFSGSGETAATVTVIDEHSNVICQAVVSSGNWTCTPSVAISNGPHTFRASQTDVAGNTSPLSTATSLTIDTTTPSAPAITSPTQSSHINTGTPTIAGTGEPGATVHITIDGNSPVDVTVDVGGNWTYPVPPTLSDGNHTVAATQTDPAGNTSVTSPTITFTVDTIRPSVTVNQKAGQPDPTAANSIFFTVVFSEAMNPSTVTLTDITLGTSPTSPGTFINSFTQFNSTTWEFEVKGMANGTTVTASMTANKAADLAGNLNTASTSTDNSVLYQVLGPSIDHQSTNDTTPTLTGGCSAGDNLTINLTGPASPTYATTCDGTGHWSHTPTTPLPEGTYDVLVTDTSVVPNISNSPDNSTAALTIDTTPPSVGIERAAGQPELTNVNSADFTITFSETIQSGTLDASDFAIAGSTGMVTNLVQNTPTSFTATITGMTSGDTATITLPAGTVTDVNGNDNTASTGTTNWVTYDATPPGIPVITSPANGSSTNDNTPTITGTGEPGATVTPRIDGTIIFCEEANPLTVDSNGNWSCTPTSPIIDGTHMITATQTDPVGNTSSQSVPITVTIDTTTPAAPDITGPAEGAELTDTTPTVSGTGEPGDTITVRDENGNLLCTTTVAGDGTWSCDISPIPEGRHILTAIQTDPAGNVSPASNQTQVHVAINTDGAPAAVEDAAPNNGDGNGDGIQDSEQGNVTSQPNPVTGGYTTLEVTGGNCPFVNFLQTFAQSSLPFKDDGLQYPLGLWNYSFDCYGVGKQASVRIFLNKTYNTSNWEWRKYNSLTQQFSTMQPEVGYAAPAVGATPLTTVSYHVIEGGPLDEDGVANGTFTDPNGPTFAETLPTNPLANTGQNIFWIIALALTLLGGSTVALVIRRRYGTD